MLQNHQAAKSSLEPRRSQDGDQAGLGNELEDTFCKVRSFKGVVKTRHHNHLEKIVVPGTARAGWW